MHRALRDGGGRQVCCAAVMCLGLWGQDTSDYLGDADPAVRACAALAPACAQNSQAADVVLKSLEDPWAAASWLTRPMPGLAHDLPAALLDAALRRGVAFEDVLPAAVKTLPLLRGSHGSYGFGGTEGASGLLALAFPDGIGPDTILDDNQRTLVEALARSNLSLAAPRDLAPGPWGPLTPEQISGVYLRSLMAPFRVSAEGNAGW